MRQPFKVAEVVFYEVMILFGQVVLVFVLSFFLIFFLSQR